MRGRDRSSQETEGVKRTSSRQTDWVCILSATTYYVYDFWANCLTVLSFHHDGDMDDRPYILTFILMN